LFFIFAFWDQNLDHQFGPIPWSTKILRLIWLGGGVNQLCVCGYRDRIQVKIAVYQCNLVQPLKH